MPLAIVTANQTLFDKYQANVLAFDNMEEDSQWLQEFADGFRDVANDLWDNEMVTNWFLDDLTVSFISGAQISYSVRVPFSQGNLQGNNPGGGLPAGSSLLVSTSYVGPGPNRGRVYFSGLPETVQGDGVWTVAVRNVFSQLVVAWRDGFNIGGVTASLQILRRPSDKFPAYVANPVQSISVERAVRSQRRRNPD